MGSMRTAVCAVLLIVAVAAGAAQAMDCPDLFLSVTAAERDAVVRDCTGMSPIRANRNFPACTRASGPPA